MEVIQLSSYTDEEKLQIAKRHLLPKQLAEHGLKKGAVASATMLRAVIRDYTREVRCAPAGAAAGALCRKADMRLLGGNCKAYYRYRGGAPLKFLDCQPFPRRSTRTGRRSAW